MTTITVNASRTYDVIIGQGLLDRAGDYIAECITPGIAAVISDDTVDALCGDRVRTSLQKAGFEVVSYAFPHGEASKNIMTYAAVLNFLAESRLSRSDIIVALGGGVVGDLAGFAAASYLRGIRFVQIPTTLLAAVDSSVGGKTAIDLDAGKNLAGAFCQPSLVICDYDTLSTLPADYFRDGCAEVIKYGMLGNPAFFQSLKETMIEEQIETVIATSVSMKRDIVMGDEFDTGMRQLLNFGHTFGHAIEACSQFAISHGSAVAIGMVVMTRAAVRQGLCDPYVLEEVIAILRQYQLPIETTFTAEELFAVTCSDKKISGKNIQLVVPTAIGSCVLQKIPVSEMLDWLKLGLAV